MWREDAIDEWLGDSFGRLVSPGELAMALGISQSTVRRMMVRDELPTSVRIGRQHRWRVGDLREWMSGLNASD